MLKLFLGKNKLISPSDILTIFIEDSKHRKIIAEYCIQDTMLPQRLADRLDILPIQIEMSNVTHVPLRYLFGEDNRSKCFHRLSCLQKNGFLFPHLNSYIGDQSILCRRCSYIRKENSDFK